MTRIRSCKVSWRRGARCLAVLGMLLLASMPLAVVAEGQELPPATVLTNKGPALATDASDYSPHSVVHVTGSGFQPGTRYALPVMAPDGNVEKVNPNTYVPTLGVWGMVTADANGNLSYKYQLDDGIGLYTVRAYPSSWAGVWDGTYLADVTFTDTLRDQRNDPGCTPGRRRRRQTYGLGETRRPAAFPAGGRIHGAPFRR